MAQRFVIPADLRDSIIEQYQSGVAVRQIALAHGWKQERLSRELRALGVRMRRHAGHRFRPQEEIAIVAAYRKGKSLRSIAAHYGSCEVTVRRVLRRHRVPLRPPGGQKPSIWRFPRQVERAIALRKQGLSEAAIGKRLGVEQTTVNRLMRRHGLVGRKAKGEDHGNWKGGRHVTAIGYVQVLVALNDPYRSMANSSGYVMEHRLVMAQQLGRALRREETVHHVNGDRADNRPENLQLRIGKHGNGTAYVCADCGSHNMRALPLAATGST